MKLNGILDLGLRPPGLPGELLLWLLAFAILFAALRILSKAMQYFDALRASRTFQDIIVRRPRLKPLLAPERRFDPDLLAMTGIVPHHVTVGPSGLTGVVSYLRMSTVRPSSPKMAYVLPWQPQLERAHAWDNPAVRGAGRFPLDLARWGLGQRTAPAGQSQEGLQLSISQDGLFLYGAGLSIATGCRTCIHDRPAMCVYS